MDGYLSLCVVHVEKSYVANIVASFNRLKSKAFFVPHDFVSLILVITPFCKPTTLFPRLLSNSSIALSANKLAKRRLLAVGLPPL